MALSRLWPIWITPGRAHLRGKQIRRRFFLLSRLGRDRKEINAPRVLRLDLSLTHSNFGQSRAYGHANIDNAPRVCFVPKRNNLCIHWPAVNKQRAIIIKHRSIKGMSASIDLERRLATWLEQDGPADVPAAAVEAALAQARTIRQRRARLTRTWWDRRPLVAAPAPVEAGAIEPGERIPTFPVARSPLRPAWVLLLLAGLLAALVGGTLLVGSQQQRRLPAVVPPVGQVFECPPGSTPDEPGPVDQARPRRWPWSAMAFDRRAGRLVALADTGDGVETWTFDVCTNTWTRMHPNREPPSFELRRSSTTSTPT